MSDGIIAQNPRLRGKILDDETGDRMRRANPAAGFFMAANQHDSDNDGAPDAVETSLGFDPLDPDIARLCGVESEGHLKVLFRRRGRRIRASVQKAESRRKSAMGRWRMPFREKSISSMDRTNLG